MIPRFTSIAAFAMVLAIPASARANAAEPTSYRISAEGSDVLVCPRNFRERGCPDAGGMLRQNVKTGEVVKLVDDCRPREGDPDCYLDKCVPAGTYRYGFATPYTCQQSSASTDFWEDITITDGCADAPTAHAAYAGKAPWTGKQEICRYGDDAAKDNGCGHCVIGRAESRSLSFAVLAALALLFRRRAR